ncbi:MAG TPA: EamA family transporter RarD [Gemmataceae bacterium]|nr:EamA family transporter RarD [Gemmataceae bacterium]
MGGTTPAAQRRAGLLYAIAAYGMWGLVPLYFKNVSCSPQEIVAHRVLWSGVFLSILVTLLRRWPEVWAAFRSRRTLLMLFTSAYLVAGNWYVYVFATDNEQITQASLGYFILPLVNVFAGIAFFGDRLRLSQVVALTIAAAGVAYLTIGIGELPWISLFLAFSFALYGIVRKVVPVDGVIGLTVETFLLAPTAIVLLIVWEQAGTVKFGHGDRELDGLIALSGIITTLPLICFAQAVRKVSLVTIGVLQFLSPTLQLLVAIVRYHEDFRPLHQFSFGLIWFGLIVYVADGIRIATRKRAAPAIEPVPEPIDGGVPLTDSQLAARIESK